MANLRVKKKHLNPDSVDGTKLKLLVGEGVRAVDSLNNVVDLVKLDTSGNVLGNGFELAKKVDLNAEMTSRQNAVSTEESARIAADASLQSALSSLESAVTNDIQAAIDSEITARTAADATLQAAIDAEVTARQTAIDAEVSSRQAAINLAITDLVDGAPAILDTLKELSDALGGDDNFFTTIDNRFTSLESSLSTASTAYTDQKHQEVLDLISLTLVKKELVTISAQNASDGYVDLAATNVIEDSMTVHLDRLSLFEGEDFTLSVVGGVTRMTFINSFEPLTGSEAFAGDGTETLRITYWSLS